MTFKKWAIFAALTLTSSLTQAQTMLINANAGKKNAFEAHTVFSILPMGGHTPVKVTISNSADVARTWTLNFTSVSNADYGNEGNQLAYSINCTCAANSTQSFTLNVPIVKTFPDHAGHRYGMSGDQSPLQLKVIPPEGPVLEGASYDTASGDIKNVAMSSDLASRNSNEISKISSHFYSSSGYSGRSYSDVVSSFNPADLPEDWIGYTGIDTLILTDNQWLELSPGARTAILQWNRNGGELVIAGESSPPTAESLAINVTSSTSAPSYRSFGNLILTNLNSEKKINTLALNTIFGGPTSSSFSPYELEDNAFSSGWNLYNDFPPKNENRLFFILLLLAFAILVGPVNIFVFAGMGKRHKLFITTPIISIIACALMVLLIFFQDGTGGKGNRIVLMDLQAGDENNAYIQQEQLARTGILLGSSFDIPENASISPLPLTPSRWTRISQANNGGSSQYSISPEDKIQRVSGDWFQSRSLMGHKLSSVQPNRGNLSITSSTTPSINSSLDFPLKRAIYVDRQGKWWVAQNIGSGDTIAMDQISKNEATTWLSEISKPMSTVMKEKFDRISNRRDSYIAITDSGPAIETLVSIDWQTTTIISGSNN